MIITFRGKDIELKMTYKSIHYLEMAFDKAYTEFLLEQTEFNQTLYIFWAMLQNDPEYMGKSVSEVADLLQESLEAYEFTLAEYFTKVNQSYQSSVLVKQLFETDGKDNFPSDGGRQGRASIIGRKVLHGIMFRLRNFSQRFLDKHSL